MSLAWRLLTQPGLAKAFMIASSQQWSPLQSVAVNKCWKNKHCLFCVETSGMFELKHRASSVQREPRWLHTRLEVGGILMSMTFQLNSWVLSPLSNPITAPCIVPRIESIVLETQCYIAMSNAFLKCFCQHTPTFNAAAYTSLYSTGMLLQAITCGACSLGRSVDARPRVGHSHLSSACVDMQTGYMNPFPQFRSLTPFQ